MPKKKRGLSEFDVEVTRMIEICASFTVEAANEEAAQEKVENIMQNMNVNWQVVSLDTDKTVEECDWDEASTDDTIEVSASEDE